MHHRGRLGGIHTTIAQLANNHTHHSQVYVSCDLIHLTAGSWKEFVDLNGIGKSIGGKESF